MKKIDDEQERQARLAIASLPSTTFEQMLDTTLLNRTEQLWARQLWQKDVWKSNKPYSVREPLLSKNAGHYVDILSCDEIRDIRRRNHMAVPMPKEDVPDFMRRLDESLRRTGIGRVLQLLEIGVELRRDQHERVHVVFIDKLNS